MSEQRTEYRAAPVPRAAGGHRKIVELALWAITVELVIVVFLLAAILHELR